jgi:hypothetical protein
VGGGAADADGVAGAGGVATVAAGFGDPVWAGPAEPAGAIPVGAADADGDAPGAKAAGAADGDEPAVG